MSLDDIVSLHEEIKRLENETGDKLILFDHNRAYWDEIPPTQFALLIIYQNILPERIRAFVAETDPVGPAAHKKVQQRLVLLAADLLHFYLYRHEGILPNAKLLHWLDKDEFSAMSSFK
jgi:hypothetical protein